MPAGTISASAATGNVTAAGSHAGGLIGLLQDAEFSDDPGQINESYATGDVTGNQSVGGLVGKAVRTNITNAYATGSVDGNASLGGLVGNVSGGNLTNASASGTVSVPDDTEPTEYVGGLVGQMYLGNITRSSASGTVDTPDATHVGGLVGYADATEPEPQGGVQRPIPVGRTIRESYATGDVTGDESVGGLVGTNRNETVVHSYAVGNVTGDTAVGGLVGTHTGANANVTEVYSAGTVSEGTDAGGLIGTTQESPTVESAYWDTQTTAQSSSVAGTGLTTSQLKADESLAGFDFQNTWDVRSGTAVSYPYLQNNIQSPAPGLETRVTVDARDETVEAGGQGQLVVRATASGAPAAGTQIVVESDDGLSGISTGDTAVTNATGEATFSFSGSATGTYTLTVVLAGDETVSDTATVTVETVRAGDDTDDETSSGGGGGGGGLSASRADVTASQPTESGEGAAYTVSLRNVYSGQQVVADFTTEQATTGFVTPGDDTWPPTATTETPAPERSAVRNVQSDGLVLTVADRGDYDLSVSARDVDVFTTNATAANETRSADNVDRSMSVFGDAGRQFVTATAQRPVGFITVDHNFESEDLETATHRFRVRKSYLAATGTTSESVTLYREEPESYRALSTRRVGEDDAYYYFEADTPGFSTFVIGTEAPMFDLGEPTLEQADVKTGVIDVSVPVENIGTEPGTYTARLRGNGVVLAETEVSVPAGETVEATVRATAPDADGLVLTIAGQPLGEFTVEDSGADGSERTTDAETRPTTDAEDATDEPSDTADGSALGGRFLVLLVAVVVVVVAIWALRRRDEP